MAMTNEELEKELGATREFTWKLEEKIVNLEGIIEQLERRIETLEAKNRFDRSILLDMDM